MKGLEREIETLTSAIDNYQKREKEDQKKLRSLVEDNENLRVNLKSKED